VARLNWDRESREARKRKHGAVPVWADPAAISHVDSLRIHELLRPLVETVDEFEGLSRTQQRQRGSEFGYRLRRQAKEAREGCSFDDAAVRAVLMTRLDHLVERLRRLESEARS
jgi:hypothetical protein